MLENNLATIADKCPNIQIEVVHLNEDRIKNWNNSDLSQLPIYEPGLANIVKRRRGKIYIFPIKLKKKLNLLIFFLSR